MGDRWAEHVKAWSNPPVDDVGYIPANTMLSWPDDLLRHAVLRMRTTRYSTRGYRNWENRWRDLMGLDTTRGKDILDFGCGTGVEALELAQAGNRVSLADISEDNLALAARVFAVHDQEVHGTYLIRQHDPHLDAPDGVFDVFHCNGVLHHSRTPVSIMARAHQLLRPGGLARLMMYSDHGWRIATGTEPPDNPEKHPKFKQFVRFFDSVGNYADWYNLRRIGQRFGGMFTVERIEYLTPDLRFLGAELRKKDTL